MRRFRWLGWMAALVALPGLVVLVEHGRGRAALERTLVELRERGEILDASSLLPPPVPAASNGFVALKAVSGRLGALPDAAPGALKLVGIGVAVPGTRLEQWEGTGTGSTQTWAKVEAALEARAEELSGLRAAVKLPVRQATLDPAQGFAHMDFSHLTRAKQSAQALGVAAMAQARRGQFDLAVQDLEAARVLEADRGREPTLISQLVGCACSGITSARVWAVLHARDWNDAQLERLQRTMTGPAFAGDVIRSLEFERAVMVTEFRNGSNADLSQMMYQDVSVLLVTANPPLTLPTSVDEAWDALKELVERSGGKLRTSVWFPVWRYGWGDHATVHYLRALDTLLTFQREAVRRGYASTEADLSAWVEPSTAYGRWCSHYTKESLVGMAGCLAKAFRAETERALHETGIAVHRFQRRHQRLPESLNELVPEFLAAMPMDRMDGKPLRYRRDSAEDFTLWSVGVDRIDGNALQKWKAGQTGRYSGPANWWLEDAVWPRCASAAQIAAAQEIKPKTLGLDPVLMQRYGLIPKQPKQPKPAVTNPAPAAAP
jgi:hypothetical protein